MPDRITFNKNINESVQVGDSLYFSTITSGVLGAETSLGTITAIGKNYVEVDDASAASADDFFMFLKPKHDHSELPNGGYTNTSSLKGYFAEVTLENTSTSSQELFVVGSETTISSK
jgi:hypothetical protein